MTEKTWQLDLLNSTKPSLSTPLRKPAMPIVDLTNLLSVQTDRRREVHNSSYLLYTITVIVVSTVYRRSGATGVVGATIFEIKQNARQLS